jgi:non-ribosomal peptide synthetase component F
MVLLAAFAAALGKYTGQPDVVIGSAVSRRTQSATEQMFGQFMNTLLLRISLADRASLRALVPQVKAVMLAALEHQDAPFVVVLAEATAAYGPAAAGIGQAIFIIGDVEEGSVEMADLSLSLLEHEHVTSRRELTLSIAVTNGEIAGTMTYDRDLFNHDTVERIRRDFEAAVASVRD